MVEATTAGYLSSFYRAVLSKRAARERAIRFAVARDAHEYVRVGL
jgi:hypothetical protein